MFRVGITERGDAGLDFTWVDKLLPANIIISKNLNDELISYLIANKDKIIFHITCTGFADTSLEPNVPPIEYNHNQVKKLIADDFPVRQIVLRVDPIIPTKKGINTAEIILKRFMDTGIKRVRYSFLDMYPHVLKRFEKADIREPYSSFTCPYEMKIECLEMLKKYNQIYELEACAEDTPHQLGCISQKDLNILEINENVESAGYQRPKCLCISGKTELLTNKTRCVHKCLYCYWKG